ncbi:MAG: hypothetical protein IH857_07530, partial [Deltaproteobacteria bacterium]|nr:hypothetical protein [Deltaproteobacteria bacterium]
MQYYRVIASPFLGEASGGSYVDEVTGGTVTLLGSDRVTAMVPAGTTRLTISLLTHMAAARAGDPPPEIARRQL